MRIRSGVTIATALIATLVAWGGRPSADGAFPHLRHARLFPTCNSCHQIEGATATIPQPSFCAACHNGQNQPRVDWAGRTRTPSNLAFDHTQVTAAKKDKLGMDFKCSNCHQKSGGEPMDVVRVTEASCLGCHASGKVHTLDAPCATCHVSSAEARDYTGEEILAFPKPDDHDDAFALEHGQPATDNTARCAVCHSRDLCSTCHVNAATVPPIQALEPDPRVAEIVSQRTVTYPLPASHRADAFAEDHADAAADISSCATCHTQESCRACHVSPLPDPIPELAPGRSEATGSNVHQAQGVVLERRAPSTHTANFAENHKALAATATSTCNTCHTQDQCITCHLGSETVSAPGEPVGRYHPENFVVQHSAPAFGQDVECATCHNPAAFCQECHTGQGLASSGRIDTGFHNRKPTWVFGHGQAARQGLETCATCHSQRDCLQCHSALGGRRINPHGPDFDPEKIKSKSPAMCLACHNRGILD